MSKELHGQRKAVLLDTHHSPATNLFHQQTCEGCPVKDFAICSALGPEVSKSLGSIMSHKVYHKGDIIWVEGDEATFFSIILSGAVKLIKTLEDGRQQIVGLQFPADCIGNPFGSERKTSAEAVTDTVLCSFQRTAFEDTLHENKTLEHALLKRSLQDLDDARNWIIALGRLSATEKVANFLHWLATRSTRSRCENLADAPGKLMVKLPFTRAEIADFLGLTIETVSRKFTDLGQQGVIELIDPHTVRIPNITALKRVANA